MEELFWDALPQYMAIGMTVEEFWHGPFDLAVAYRRAWEAKLAMRFREEWRQGAYTLKALTVALDHAFNKDAKSEYPDAPLFSTEKEREVAEQERQRRQAIRFKEQLEARAASINARFARRQGG